MIELPEGGPLLQRMGKELCASLERNQRTDPAVVGIHTGGAWVAQRLRDEFLPDAPLGSLDIAFYRDDFSQIGLQPGVRPSELPFSVEGRHLVLVDDVLMTGRTIRAALNELFDYGRPAAVTLVTLVAMTRGRGPRESFVALGYAGWDAGQLERELMDNAWLSCPADYQILFELEPEQRLNAAARSLGIDLSLLTSQAGHA